MVLISLMVIATFRSSSRIFLIVKRGMAYYATDIYHETINSGYEMSSNVEVMSKSLLLFSLNSWMMIKSDSGKQTGFDDN